MRKFFNSRAIDQKAYWILRKKLSLYNLKYRSKTHTLKSGLKAEAINASTLLLTLKTTSRSMITAFTISTALYYLDKWIAPHLAPYKWAVPDDGDYVTFLSAVGGIGGVFIGLYYAALTSVGSAIYAKVPNNIRDLLAKERSGNVYMHYLSMLTLLCVTLIAFRICGLSRMVIAVPFIAILSGAGIIAFVKLGKTAFNLFDPTALSHHIFEDLNKAIAMTMVDAPYWTEPAFQHHAYKTANKSIETLRLLIEITIQEPHQNGRPLTQLCSNTLLFLSAYESFRLKIPTNSHWYPQQYKHRDWYSTAGHSVMIAHRTGTALQPEMTRSHAWIETQLHPDIGRALSINITRGRYTEVTIILNHLEIYAQAITANGSVDKAFNLITKISETAVGAITSAAGRPLLSELEILSIVESLAALPITIILELFQFVERTNSKKMCGMLAGINWASKKSLYYAGVPLLLLPQVEWISARLSMELIAEGRIISPFWYQNDITNLGFSKALAEITTSFTTRSIEFYTNLTANFSSYDDRWLMACIQSREYEFWHKADRTRNALISRWHESKNLRVLVGLPWPTIDEERQKTAIEARKKELLSSLSKQTMLLIRDTPDNYPDYPGQFSFIIGESFLTALCENDKEMSSSIFQSYALSSIARFEKLKPQPGATGGLEDTFKIAAACLLDLIELSGYAKLLSELHENPELWQPVQSFWSTLATGDSSEAIKAYLAVVVHLNGSGFGLPLRGEMRFDWERKIWDALRELEVEQTAEYNHFSAKYQFVHPSSLIRSIDVGRHSKLPSGYNIFVVCLYIPLMLQSEFELSWEQKDLLKILGDATSWE